jgi:aryl-alcohol dehydrogenase-like predicted oxidoreductase
MYERFSSPCWLLFSFDIHPSVLVLQPRFSQENIATNVKGREAFLAMAKEKGFTPAQLALAWVHAQGGDVIPIPGTKSAARVVENAAAVTLRGQLSAADVAAVGQSIPALAGSRYPEAMMGMTFQGRL